jgi:hypothetical protein
MVEYSFVLYSPLTNVTFPYVQNCCGLKVSKFMFKFSEPYKNVLTLSLPSYDQKIYFDGINQQEYYTFICFNDGSVSKFDYINNTDNFDIKFLKRSINSLNFTIKINCQMDTLVCMQNPIYITIDFLTC